VSLDCRNPPFKPGQQVLSAVVQRLIGRGGQGYVFEAYHHCTKAPLAIKVIPISQERARAQTQRAIGEATILFKLRHPNIVQVTDAGAVGEGLFCIVMELLRGRSLRALLLEVNRIRVDEALLIGAQIADAIRAAHECDAIHRDLKPENVFIEPGNVVKVLDFGIAKITGLGNITTQQNLVQGTVQYMSPEHLQGRKVTEQSDIFALGCLLYELMSGSTPATIGADVVNVQIAGWNQIMLKPPRLDSVLDSIPNYVGRAIQQMLAKEPDERPATMRQVARELRAIHARYSNRMDGPVRKLWLPGASVANLPTQPFAIQTTTTVPDVVNPHEDSEWRQAKPATSEHTEPLPLLVRNAAQHSEEPSVIIQDPSLLLQQETTTGPQNVNGAVAKISTASDESTFEPLQVHPRHFGSRAVLKTFRHTPEPSKIHWPKVALALASGIALGAAALFVMAWSSRTHDANADSIPAVRRVAAPPLPVQLPSRAATPAPVLTVASVEPSPPTAAPFVSVTPTGSIVGAKITPPPTASGRPDIASNLPATKPAPRKAKASTPTLPFSADQLTF